MADEQQTPTTAARLSPFERLVSAVFLGVVFWIGNSVQNTAVELKETKVSLSILSAQFKDFQTLFEKRVDGFAGKEDLNDLRKQYFSLEERVRDLEVRMPK